jgi:hypothetical protein
MWQVWACVLIACLCGVSGMRHAAVQRAVGVSGAPTSTARSSKRGLANRLVDLARQVGATCTASALYI